jgi:hypothetical protein
MPIIIAAGTFDAERARNAIFTGLHRSLLTHDVDGLL